jgi:hypothetical protein
VPTIEEQIAAAQAAIAENEAKVAAYQEKLRVENEIAVDYTNNQPISAIVEMSGYSVEQVRRVLADRGLLSVRKRKLDAEETQSVLDALKNGEGVAETVERLNVAESLVRRIAKDAGIVSRKRVNKRTPEEIEKIRVLDAALRKEFGAGLGGLAEVIRKADKEIAAAVQGRADGVGEDEPVYPSVEPGPITDEGDINFVDEGELAKPREHHGDGDEPMPVTEDFTTVGNALPEVKLPSDPEDVPW